MTTNILKSELTKAIAGINDKSLLEVLYKIIKLSEQPKPVDYEVSEEDWAIVEAREKEYKAGKAKTVTMSQIRKSVMKKLSK